MSAGTRPLPGAERVPAFVAIAAIAGQATVRRDTIARTVLQRYPLVVRSECPGDVLLLTGFGDRSLPVTTNREGTLTILGRLFERGNGRTAPSMPANIDGFSGAPDALARMLVADHWGSYLAVLRDRESGHLHVLRDPSGALPACLIDDGDVIVLADQIPRWLHDHVAGRPCIDWDVVTAQLHDPSVASHRSMLANLRRLTAGAVTPLVGGAPIRQVWTPAAAMAGPLPPDERLESHLRYVVRDAVATLTSDHDRLLLELSGGLDSAILLSCLTGRHRGGAPACLNLATRQPGGDERAYARSAADRHGAMLTEVMLAPDEMDYTGLADQSDISEPRLYGSDATHDRLSGALAEALDASAIVTGQGGDAVFFQEPTPLVAADHLRHAGLNRLTWQTVRDCADRSHGSVWSVLAAARAARRGPMFLTPVEHDALLLGPAARREVAVPRHPWLSDVGDLPPAKIIQIQLLAGSQFFRGPAPVADRFDLLHPLLAQPVVELCLAIPSWKLAFGRHDRALARAAYAADLPEQILKRRGKGEASTYYSHAILANLPFLRDLLIDGLLADRGLLDRDQLDRALTERSLVHRADHRVLIAYASLEGWLRSWS